MSEHGTLKDLAASHDVTLRTAQRWQRRGFVVRRPDGAVNVTKTDRLLKDLHLGSFAAATPRHAEGTPDAEVQKRKAFALMRRRELEVSKIENRLVDAALAKQEQQRCLNHLFDRLAEFPERRAPEIAAQLGKPVQAVEKALQKMMVQVLTELRAAIAPDE